MMPAATAPVFDYDLRRQFRMILREIYPLLISKGFTEGLSRVDDSFIDPAATIKIE
jgi:hypothetical protein